MGEKYYGRFSKEVELIELKDNVNEQFKYCIFIQEIKKYLCMFLLLKVKDKELFIFFLQSYLDLFYGGGFFILLLFDRCLIIYVKYVSVFDLVFEDMCILL